MFGSIEFGFKAVLLLCTCLAVIQDAAANNSTAVKDIKISGGIATTIKAVPYLVYIQQFSILFLCGGALVSPRHVVTAAHCVFNVQQQTLQVIGGTTQRGNKNALRRRVSSIFIPLGFRMNTYNLDVAVVKLSTAMTGSNIRTIGLCRDSWTAGSLIQVSGWGKRNKFDLSRSLRVRTVRVPIISKGTCKQRYQNNRLSKNMFCADTTGRRGFCGGDGGGPAVYRNRLCGIVSWSNGCSQPRFPGVYTSVKQTKKFIVNAMRK